MRCKNERWLVWKRLRFARPRRYPIVGASVGAPNTASCSIPTAAPVVPRRSCSAQKSGLVRIGTDTAGSNITTGVGTRGLSGSKPAIAYTQKFLRDTAIELWYQA